MPRKSKARAVSQDAVTSRSLPSELLEACQGLDIKPEEVMSYRIYPDRVVLVVGPVGRKVIWPKENHETRE